MKLKRKRLARMLSLAAAAAVSCSGFAGTTVLQTHAETAEPAAVETNPMPTAEELEQAEAIPFIITLEADAILTGETDTEYLNTPDAAAEAGRIRRMQDQIIAQIREWYPNLEIGFRYTTAINGFSCRIPAMLSPFIYDIPGVKSVTKCSKMKVKEQMAMASQLGGFPAYYDETDCHGEGQVIALIDSEIDATHPMFAPLPDEASPRLTKNDIARIANGIGFNIDIDPERAYLNSKIPFAVDYVTDPYSDVPNDEDYHGTHVAGIAAGETFTDSKGTTFSGVAPNAQLVFMAMDAAMFNFEEIAVAELEDAIKLQVDVINMSLGVDGENHSYDPIQEAVSTAEKAGITVCIAAGNADDGTSSGLVHTADNPDRSQMNAFVGEGSCSLAVASSDNPIDEEFKTLQFGDQLMPCTGSVPYMSYEIRHLGDLLGETPYEYVYCGLGYEEDFEGKDLNGKLALIDRGQLDFEEKAYNARMAGAVGAIIVQSTYDPPLLMTNSDDLLLAMISKENGDILKNASPENRVVHFSTQTVTITKPQVVSNFTSYGIHSDLELRPDIMGVGGAVESAAYGQSAEVMDGTSMATPYLSGCTALLNEFLQKSGCTLTGSEKSRYIRNLLMTSAVPYQENNMYVTPRRQGSGFVSVNNAIHTKVLLTGAEGESKLSLRDNLGTQFSFPVTITNISNEDVKFESARLALTTDDTYYDSNLSAYVISGQQPLACSADFGNLTEIAAGETKTETVTVALDASQAEALKLIFTNGFFIDGYLLLEGADNTPDISIPMTGFSDDFFEIPFLSEPLNTYVKTACGDYFNSDSLAERSEFALQYFNENLDQNTLDYMREHIANLEDNLLGGYELEEQYKAKYPKNSGIYISPNGDHMAELPLIKAEIKRNGTTNGIHILDADGNDLTPNPQHAPLFSGESNVYTTDQLLNNLPDGEYTASWGIVRPTDATGDERIIPEIQVPLTIDTVSPTIRTSKKEVNGRTILTLKANDKNLDGIYVLGVGTGGKVGDYDPKHPNSQGMLPFCATIAVTALNASDYIYNTNTFNMEELDDNSSFEDQERMLEKESIIYDSFYDYEDLPICHSMWQRNGYEETLYRLDEFNFSDIIPATPDENGDFTLEYDITDLDQYLITAADRAYNIAETAHYSESAKPNHLTAGIYTSDNGIYEIKETQFTFTPCMKNNPITYYYTLEDGIMTINRFGMPDEYDKQNTSRQIQVSGNENTGYRFRSDNLDTLLQIYTDTVTSEKLNPTTDMTTTEGFFKIFGYEAEREYLKPYMDSLIPGIHFGMTEYKVSNGIVTYTIHYYGEVYEEDMRFIVDLHTGMVQRSYGNGRDENLGYIWDLLKDIPLVGDVDESGDVDVSDAVLLARFLAEDSEAIISGNGLQNADCNKNGAPDLNDVVMILRAIAQIIVLR